jgi:4-hydroxy-tetrahydrodipicolinate reductase
VVHCTSSSLKIVAPQLAAILKTKTPIVSTTEELAYPWRAARRLAIEIDTLAKKAKVAVLATGVNPGFAMDALPITISAACERVDAIHVQRVQDARIRRLPFQQKIGAGLSIEEFEQRVAAGTVRHVGFSESIAMIGDALGWPLDKITDEIKPKVATQAVSSTKLKVKAGEVAGIIQDGVGYRRGQPVITLHLEAYLGAPETCDAVEIEGSPNLSMKFSGGIHGDIATASMVVNSIPKVLAASPGLRTMRDLPIPSFFGSAQ